MNWRTSTSATRRTFRTPRSTSSRSNGWRERDPSRTAAVHDHATTIFVSHVPDPERASAHAREAWTLDPSPARAAEFADRAFYASLPDEAASKTNDDLEAALEATERALTEATDDDLVQLLNARAWVLQRLGDAPKGSVSARLPWILAGAAVHPQDGVLLAVAGWDAQALGYKAAGVLLAAEGLSRQPEDATTRESALTTSVSYRGDRARSLPHTESPGQTDEGWENAVDLYVALHGSDWNRAAEILDRPMSDDAWVKRTHALGLALLHGLDAAETALNEALDASWDDRENLQNRALVAAVLRSPEQLDRIVAEEADDPDADRVRGECALIARFVADSSMTPEMYLEENLRYCFCPSDVFGLVNLALPLLVAARTGEKPAIEPRWREEPAVQRRLLDLSDPAAAWLVEREAAGGWWKLAELAMHASEPGAVIDLIRSAPGGTSGLPAVVVERLERLVLRRACEEMPRGALAALAGRGPAVPPGDVAALFDPDVDAAAEDRLAVALLLDSPAQASAPAEDEVAATVDRIVTLISTTTDERGEAVRDLWTIDARLCEAAATPTWTPVAALARPRLMTALDELFGLRSPVDVNPYTLPVIGEVADDLVPFVDDSQDHGHFLFELVPAMRSRIHSSTGVEVLGIRARPNPDLLAGGFRILIDEVPVHSGSVAASEPEAIPDALVHEFESELHRHLDRFLGPAEVEQALTLWRLDDDDQLVASVVPDADAILLLTWVLQAMLRDGLPIVDWRSILRTIQRQGGLTQPPSALHQALRDELQVHLPGRQQGRERVPLPPDLEGGGPRKGAAGCVPGAALGTASRVSPLAARPARRPGSLDDARRRHRRGTPHRRRAGACGESVHRDACGGGAALIVTVALSSALADGISPATEEAVAAELAAAFNELGIGSQAAVAVKSWTAMRHPRRSPCPSTSTPAASRTPCRGKLSPTWTGPPWFRPATRRSSNASWSRNQPRQSGSQMLWHTSAGPRSSGSRSLRSATRHWPRARSRTCGWGHPRTRRRQMAPEPSSNSSPLRQARRLTSSSSRDTWPA